jgi:hypothetical protein
MLPPVNPPMCRALIISCSVTSPGIDASLPARRPRTQAEGTDRTAPPHTRPAATPPDKLLAFLESLWIPQTTRPGHRLDQRRNRREPQHRHNRAIGIISVIRTSDKDNNAAERMIRGLS